MTDRIRRAARTLSDRKWFSKKELFDAVETRSRLEDRSFLRSWRDIYLRGEIVRLGEAKYRYVPENSPRSDVRNRIYRAMHVKGVFCGKDIQKLTEADHSYIMATIRKLVKAGHLEFTGKNNQHKIFRVRNSHTFYLKFVREKS